MVKVSNDLLDDKLNIYLPNKNIFILELVTERLGDPKFVRLRKDFRIWELLNKTYELQNDLKLRNRTFQSFKSGDAIIGALNDTKDEKLFLEILKTIHNIRLNVTVTNLYDQSIPILTSLLETLTSTDLQIDQYSIEIISFFNSAVTIEKFTKKFINNFILNSLAIVLNALSLTKSETSKKLLNNLIKKIILNDEDLIVESTNLLLSSKKISKTSIVTYFKLVLNSLPRLETAKIEELYSKIIEKFPEASEYLLEFISNNNRVLSSDFLQNIFQIEINKEEINFNLILYVLTLDVDVGLRFAEKLMKYLEDEKEFYLPIVNEIINTFNKSRYLFNFFQLWFKILEESDSLTYRSEEFQNLTASYINNLSSAQLNKLINSLISQKSNNKYIILSSIVQGMFSLKNKTIIDDSRSLFIPIFEINESFEDLWKLKYNILSLYEDIIDHKELTEIIKNSSLDNASIYQFFTIFRIREIIEFDLNKIISKFIKFLKNSDINLIKFIFKRWFVLINELFSNSEIEKMIKLLLNTKDENLLIEIFDNDEFFEQSNLNFSLINEISKNLSSENDEFYSGLLKFIPIQCYPKKLKSNIIESLTELLILNERSNILDILIDILNKTPTFRTKIETNFKELQKLMLINLSNIELFKIIWNNHVKNIKETECLTFINESIKIIAKSLKKNKSFNNDYYISLIMLNSKNLETEELKLIFTKSIKNSLLNLNLKENLNEISWLLFAINELNFEINEFSELKPILKKIGLQIQNTDNEFNSIKINLFLILTKYSNDESNVEYFESLYLILRESISNKELKRGLINLFENLSVEKFNKSIKICIASINEDNIDSLIEIILCYWTNFNKSNSESNYLFNKSISIISLNLNEISPSSIVLLLNEIKLILIEKSWLISQYNLELIISLLNKLINLNINEEIFILITVLISNILLIHRFRLSNRHHIINLIFNSLLKSLTNKNLSNKSKNASKSLSRLLSNLCEPVNTNTNEIEKLNIESSILKRNLRKHIHIILLSYINLSLKYSFNSEIRESLLPGIFNIFDVLSANELNLVNTSLNNIGRTYYKNLYDEYKKVGKWQID